MFDTVTNTPTVQMFKDPVESLTADAHGNNIYSQDKNTAPATIPVAFCVKLLNVDGCLHNERETVQC